MERDSAIKNKEIMTFAAKWMELENNILGEVTQYQKDMYGLYSLMVNIGHKVQDKHAIIHRPKETGDKAGLREDVGILFRKAE